MKTLRIKWLCGTRHRSWPGGESSFNLTINLIGGKVGLYEWGSKLLCGRGGATPSGAVNLPISKSATITDVDHFALSRFWREWIIHRWQVTCANNKAPRFGIAFRRSSDSRAAEKLRRSPYIGYPNGLLLYIEFVLHDKTTVTFRVGLSKTFGVFLHGKKDLNAAKIFLKLPAKRLF